MRVLSLLLVLCALVFLASAQVPIPNRPDGYALSPDAPATAPVVLEAFFDLLCPDSKAVWPTIKQVLSQYPQTVYFLMHTFPLPYHTYSFIINNGAHVIDHLTAGNLTAIRAYTDLLFDIQVSYQNPATAKMSPTEVYAKLASDVAGVYDDSSRFQQMLSSNGNVNTETRISWKYGCSRTVSGTPSFLLNGVYIGADSSWSLSDWQSVIDPIINATSTRTTKHHTTTHNQPTHTTTTRSERVAALSAVLNKASQRMSANETCPAGQAVCDYEPKKYECCLKGENCIPNVGCRCLAASGRC